MSFSYLNANLTSFDSSEFCSGSFSVDEFIQGKRYSVPLDVLRDDLGAHIKSLRCSLIELINKDYGQFVSLSSNLVGLDGKIQDMTGPLTRAHNELEILHETLRKILERFHKELEGRRTICATKFQLRILRRAHICLVSSEKYLEVCPTKVLKNTDFILLKLACDKITDTRQLIQTCSQSPLTEQLQKRWDSCCGIVLQNLETLLRVYSDSSVESEDDRSHNQAVVTSLLSMYSQLNYEIQAENIIINHILKSKCDKVLLEIGNVDALFTEIEGFLQHSPIIHASHDFIRFPWMKEYDFISRGIFPFVLTILMNQFPHIWSPSTPDAFHSNWVRCARFIDVLENTFPSLDHLRKFRSSVTFKDFMSKWQFNVYFQLRFHALAMELESAVDCVHSPSATSDFKLDMTRILVKVINQCWDKEKIFIWELSGRFLKANALFISRYLKEIQREVSSNTHVTIKQLISSYADVKLSESLLRQFIVDKINSLVLSHITTSRVSFLAIGNSSESDSNEDEKFLSQFCWNETKETLESKLVEVVVSASLPSISSVTEVPRLFRRTNREVPCKPSEYVNGILQPIQTLYQSVRGGNQEELWKSIGPKIGQELLTRYKAQMDQVLTSVQRMEESLKRLKKVKGKNENDNNDTKTSMHLSDDDKIRRQIQLDFELLTEEIRTLTFI